MDNALSVDMVGTGVCFQEILFAWASGLCSLKKEWIQCARNSRTRRLPRQLFQSETVTCPFLFRFSFTESRRFVPASTSVSIQSYEKSPIGI